MILNITRDSRDQNTPESTAREKKKGGGDTLFLNEYFVQEESGKSLEDELTSLEGMKVSVPFSTEYSGTSYHNAVIFAVVSTEYEVQPNIIIIAFLRRRYFVAFLRQDKIFSILVLDYFHL